MFGYWWCVYVASGLLGIVLGWICVCCCCGLYVVVIACLLIVLLLVSILCGGNCCYVSYVSMFSC